MKRDLSLIGLFILFLLLLVASNISAQEITFGPSIRVDDDTTGEPQGSPCMVAYGDSNIYIAWDDWRTLHITGYPNIYFSSSFDGGKTWTENLNITNNSTPWPDFPQMETDSKGNIYLVWGDEALGNLYFSFSSDSGKSWTQPVRINDIPGCAFSPYLAVDDEGTIYVTWSDDRYDFWLDVYFSRSADCGSTWTTPAVRVNDYTSGFQGANDIVVYRVNPSEKNIYISLTDYRSGHEEAFFSKSKDGGKTWGRNVRASDAYWAEQPKMAVDDDGTIHLLYNGRQPERHPSIFYTQSTDEGSTWATPNTMISPDTFSSQLKQDMAVDRYGNIYAVWKAKASPVLLNNQVGYYHIYFAMSQDGGQTWSDPIIRVDDSTIVATQSPCMALTNKGHIYVAWMGGKQPKPNDACIFFSWAQGPDWVKESGGEILTPRFSLEQNYPNPFNSTTAIRYQLSAGGGRWSVVNLKIYNILGGEVRTLVDKKQKAGSHQTTWDGRDSWGKEVGSGIYLYQFRAGGYKETRKMVYLR